MNKPAEFSGSVEYFAKRSNRTVLFITFFFALLPVIWKSFLGQSPDRLSEGLSVFWVPLCFLVIPIIHHLCREVVALQARVSRLEKDHIV